MLARQMLETQGLQVEGVSSGEQALERQQGALFDLVFMDIFMPTLMGSKQPGVGVNTSATKAAAKVCWSR